MALWKKTSAVVATVLVGGIISPIAPLATGQNMTSISTVVQHGCTFERPGGFLTSSQKTVVSPETVTVRYPASVAPGEVFTAYVQPGDLQPGASSMRTSNRQAGLLSYDVAFPGQHTSNLGAFPNGDASNMNGTVQVDRVRADGRHEEFGPFARISGGTTAYMGENSRNGDAINRWDGGLTVGSDRDFQFPEIGLRMRAKADAGGQTIAVGLKGAGQGNGSKSNGAVNTIQGAEQGGLGTERTSYYFCSSSANASALSSVTVDGSLPRYIAQTSTAMTSANAHLPRSARTTTLAAQVSTNEELISNVRAGIAAIRFDVRDKSTGHLVHTANGAIGADGTASVSYEFPDLTAGAIRDNYEVTATYTGLANDISPSTSAPTNISVGYNEINAGVALRSSNGQLAGGSMPVTLTADLTMPSGRTFPSNMVVQLYRNDEPHGNSVAIQAGGSSRTITFPTDTLMQEEDTKTYRYRAEVVPLVINDLDRYAGVSPVSVAAIVTGSNPGSPLPTGGEGSVSLEGFFRAPQLVWDWLTGSIGQAGTFSVGFTK